MSDLPYMPFYVADYVGDTAHLTTLEHGAYLMLLFTYWMRQKPLPDDPVKLQRIAKVTPDEWADMSATLAEFFQVGDGAWSHKRVDAELAKARDKLEKATNAGKASAEARLNKRSTSVEPTPNGGSTDAEHASNHGGKVRLSSLKTSLREPLASDFAKFWKAWPHRVRQSASERAFADAGADIEEILAGVAAYIASRSPDQQWPDPAKWLEERRWLDEYGPRTVADVGVATIAAKRQVAGKVYVFQHSPAGEAWERYKRSIGKTQLWDRDGGWLFDTEWPPPEAAASETVSARAH